MEKFFQERIIFFKRLWLFIDYYECTRVAVVTRDVCATATANLLTVYRTYGTYSAWVISKQHPVAPCSRSYLRNHFVSTSAVRASIIEPDDRRGERQSRQRFASFVRQAGGSAYRKKHLIIGDSRVSLSFGVAREGTHPGKRRKRRKKEEKHRRGRWNYAERARNARLAPCNLMQQRRGQPQCIYRVILKFYRQSSADEFLFALIYSFIENVETSRSKLCESEPARDF